jgi:hypothetical protein
MNKKNAAPTITRPIRRLVEYPTIGSSSRGTFALRIALMSSHGRAIPFTPILMIATLSILVFSPRISQLQIASGRIPSKIP